MMDFLPVNIRISDLNILIVGGGKVATHKAQILSHFTHSVTVIAPLFTPELRLQPFACIQREFAPSDLEGVKVLFICTGNHELNRHIKQLADERNILASVCDDPQLCGFTSPAIFRKDNVTVSVASDAQDVHRSIRIRNRIQQFVQTGLLDLS